MLPNCTTLCIMNKTTKQKQNAESEMYDYDFKIVLLRFQNVSCRSILIGFAEKTGFRFGLGFYDKRIVNFFMTRVTWHDFHHC